MKNAISITLAGLLMILLVVWPVMAQEGTDEVESNDTMDLANVIDGYAFSGIVGGKGDYDDWFQLNGQEGYNPGFTLYYNDAICDIDLEIWSGGEVVGTLSASHSPDYGEFYVPEACYIHVWAHSGQGDYTVEIHTDDKTIDGGQDQTTGGCQGLDEVESNNTRDLADQIEAISFEGYACPGDDDWFYLNGQEGSNPTFTLWYDSTSVDVDMEIFSDTTSVGSLTASTDPDTGTFSVPGTCYLRVYSYSGEGVYTVDIATSSGGGGGTTSSDCQGFDELESNDTQDLSDTIYDYDIEGYACAGDHDWYLLDGQEGVNPTFTLYYDDTYCDIDLEVVGDNGTIGTITGSGSPDSGSFSTPGNVWLHVYSYSGEGAYTIDISGGKGGAGGAPQHSSCEGPDEQESNDSRDIADSISKLTFEGYCCSGDEDWFVLTGQEGSWPTFTVYYDSAYADIDVDVYSDTDLIGSLTASTSPDSGTYNVPGQCYIRVYTYSGEGSYTIEINP